MNQEKEAEELSVCSPENENLEFGWSFHKTPFLLALGITIILYILIFLFVDPNPPYFDPADLPPPP